MLNTNPSRFDKYRILFTNNTEDIRFRLFLDILYTNAVNNAKRRTSLSFIDTDLEFSNVPDEMRPSNYKDSSLEKFMKPNSPIHIEWIAFFRDLAWRTILTSTVTNDSMFRDDAKILDLIKTLQPSADKLSLNDFIIKLVQSCFTISTATEDITATPAKWSTATNIGANTPMNGFFKFFDKITDKNAHDMIMMSYGLPRDGKHFNDLINKNILNMPAIKLTPVYDIIKNFYIIADSMGLILLTSTTFFSFNLEKLVLVQILERHVQNNLLTPVESSFFTDEETVKNGNKYYRDVNGILFMRSTNKGDPDVKMNPQSKDFISLIDKNCMTTHVKEDGSLKCADFLKGCLEKGDITKCKDYLLSPNFWPLVIKEVEEINPVIAVQLLKSFQFKTKENFDKNLKLNIKTVETVRDWLEGLKALVPATLTESDVTSIVKNDKLITYLEMIVKKINSSPSILNKDIKEGTVVANPDPFKGTRFSLLGVGFNPWSPASVVALNQRTAMTLNQNNQNNRGVRLNIGKVFMGLVGGSVASIQDTETKYNNQIKQTWSIINSQYLSLVSRLNANGKTIDKNDSNIITKLINELKVTEAKLYKAMLYAEKYADLIGVYGVRDNNTSLTFVQLKQFVDMQDKYLTRVSKKQSALSSIIQTIAEAVARETASAQGAAPAAQAAQAKQAASAISMDSFF